MAELIDAFQLIDGELITSVNATIKPVLLLEDVEHGSIRAWLTEMLKAVDDDALKELNLRKQIGAYLVKGKYRLIDFLNGKTKISNRSELLDLQQQLLQDAHDVQAYPFPGYKPVTETQLGAAIRLITAATAHLNRDDSATYLSRLGSAPFNLSFYMAPEEFDELLTLQTVENRDHLVLQVKKPDYLGQSMWELRHHGRTIEAKILDEEWLKSFQRREIDVRPGDALDCDVNITVRYGFDAGVISDHYDIVRVINVIHIDPWHQQKLEGQ